jgi:hypothetical protein
VRIGPLEVHPHHHSRPVLCLGTTGTGLDVEVGAGRIHFAREHALELEGLDVLLQPLAVAVDLDEGRLVVFGLGQVEELERSGEAVPDTVEATDDRFELGALTAERLGTLRLVPDRGLLQLAGDFGQPFRLVSVFKDTPGESPGVPGAPGEFGAAESLRWS